MTNTNQPVWVKALLDKTLSPAAHRVYQYLRWRQGLNGSSWPSQYRIAEDLGLTKRGVQKITKLLEKQGYIRIKRPEIQGRGQSLHYVISERLKRVNRETPFIDKKGRTENHPSTTKRVNGGSKKGRTERPPNTIHRTLFKKKSHLHQVFNHWNQKKGCSVWKHSKKITWHSHTLRADSSISPAITKAIQQNLTEGHSVEDISGAIDNYAKVLLGEDYIWSYVWPLSTFLMVKHEKHKNAERKWWQFLMDNFIEENYLTEAAKRKRANQQSGPSVYQLAKASRTKEIVNNAEIA